MGFGHNLLTPLPKKFGCCFWLPGWSQDKTSMFLFQYISWNKEHFLEKATAFSACVQPVAD